MAAALPPAAPPPGHLIARGDLLRHIFLSERLQRGQQRAAKGQPLTKSDTLTPAEMAELVELEAKRGRPAGAPERGPLLEGDPLQVSTQAQVAAVYGVATRTIENWIAEPDWPAARRGPYDLPVIGAWIRSKRERPSAAEEEARERALLRAAKRRMAEDEERRRRGELIPLAEALTVVQTLCIQLRQLLESLGREFGPGYAEQVRQGIERIEAQGVRLLPPLPEARPAAPAGEEASA
jgi:phage terminase Nu1 subunit (DNA packaging protein)